jgi:hypothetical protein
MVDKNIMNTKKSFEALEEILIEKKIFTKQELDEKKKEKDVKQIEEQ